MQIHETYTSLPRRIKCRLFIELDNCNLPSLNSKILQELERVSQAFNEKI